MPCHVPSTSVSRRRRTLFPSSPPKIAAVLDLDKPGERATHDFLQRASSGRRPMWRVLGMRRRGKALLVAVEWLRSGKAERFSVVRLSLTELAARWHYFPTAAAARAALALEGKARSSSAPVGLALAERGAA